jgi:hypothetical protein
MPDNSQWWQNAQPGEKPWEAARRAKEAKAKPQETRGVLRRAWDALNRPVIPVERGVRAVLPEDQMGPVGEHAAGGAIGLGRVAESLSSPAALGSLGTIGLLSRPGVLGDILMAFLSGDMGWEAIKNLRRTNDTDYGEALPREKTADYTAATAHGALAVAPWLHMGARAARNRPAAPKPSSGPIPDEFRVNVDPEVRAQVDLPLPRPESPIQPPQGRPAEPTAPRRVERPAEEAIRELEARNRAEEAVRQAERQGELERVRAEQEAALAQQSEGIRQWHEDPLVGDANVRRLREATRGADELPTPETPWREFEDALGAEIIPKPAKPPKFRDQRIPVEDPYKAAIDFLLEQGGINIKATKKAGTYEDWRQSLPPATWRRVMRRKGGFSPDDMAMNMQGFGIEGENHLREILSRYQKREPLRITKDEQMRQYEQQQADWERKMREDVPPEWMEAMEVDTFNDRAVPFRGDKALMRDPEFIDYDLLGMRRPGEEGFADFGPDKGYGYYPDEFTLIKVSYNAPDGLRTFYDVVQGATGKRALRMGRDMHPDALSVELDVAGNEGGFADIKQDKPKPVSMFADELLGAQARQRQEAQNDLFQRILQADPAAVSKRELLGLDKGKKKKSGSTPLLDTVKTQGSMFGE